MAEFGKLPYEISIWEDTILDNAGQTLPYFREKKIAIIASDSMDSPIMAFDKNLVEGINGSYKLTFKMYYKYTDNDGTGLKDNPLIPYMVNERKLKLHYKDEWYEFLIKDIREDSQSYTFSYTAESASIIELSKNGFNLEFAAELNNNQGTAAELGQSVVKDTNWQLIDNNYTINGTTVRNNIVDDAGRVIRSDCIIQETKEALFEYTSTGTIFPVYSISVTDAGGTQISSSPFMMNVPNGEKIYVFYSVGMTETNGDIQFIYRADGQYTTDSERNITNGGYFLIRNSDITRSAASYGYNIDYNGARLFTIGNVSEQYRGIRYVISKKTKYDPLTDKYIDIYEDTNDNKEVYVYTEIEPDAKENILNCVTNYKDFRSESGWKGGTINSLGTGNAEVDVVSAPDLITIFQNSIGGTPAIQNVDKYLPLIRIKFPNTSSVGMNSGMFDNRIQIKTYSEGQKFHCILRAKLLQSPLDPAADGLGTLSTYPGTIQVAEYSINENGAYVLGTTLLNFTSFSLMSGNQYFHAEALCGDSLNETEVKEQKIGIFFKTPAGNLQYLYIQECWIYKEVIGTDGQPIIPTEPSDYEIKINTRYKGYKPVDNSGVVEAEDITWCCEATSKESFLSDYGDYKLLTNDNSQKILSITAKESNYFNLIQSICETFECWARFTILHNADGSVKFEEWPAGSGKYRPCKYITLHKYVGQPQYAGFRYGVNLNSIQRSLVSSAIVTKLIVKSNKNKYAPNGFCAVGLARSNPTKQNALFNFDNYINTGLLDGNQLYVDLWDTTNGIGYFKVVSDASNKYDICTAKIEKINSILYPLSTQVEEARIGKQSAAQKIQDSKEICIKKFECEYEDFLKGMNERYDPLYEPAIDRLSLSDAKHLQAWCAFNKQNRKGVMINGQVSDGYCDSQTSLQEVQSFIASITQLQNEYNKYSEVLRESGEPDSVYMQYQKYKEEKEALEAERAGYVTIIEAKNKEFYNKYYRYILEGTWVSEDYVDNEKYYLDAVSVLYNSCQPQVSYDVKVIDLAALDEYKGYECHLGDKTYIEDTEFFGYVIKNGVKTPYQEEIVITELTSVLDNPSKNTIKVQTKKTQFQDLFHRITATVQSVNYANGALNRAADAVSQDLTINTDFLQASFDKNALKIASAANESVIIDEKGITTTNKAEPNNVVRIISGGIYMSRDGGETWELGMSPADGINTRMLRSGQIDTALIQIFDGAAPSFRWDSKGLNAYWKETYGEQDENDEYFYGYNYTKGVRFDRFGIYGFNGLDTETFNPQQTSDVMSAEGVKFALTWQGFLFRHASANGAILIGDLNNGVIGAGELGSYGIVITKNNNEVFRADDNGDINITGIIHAGGGTLGDWDICNNTNGISYSVDYSYVKLVPPTSTSTDKVLQFKYNDTEKFSVDSAGNVYAGNINAAGGIIGDCTIENGTLIIKNANVDSLNGIDIGKIRATVDSPPVSWPSEITATKLTVSGNGTSKIANWKVKGNKLYNGIDTLNPSSGSGVCLDAGDSNDPSGITIYEDSNNYFKFDTSNGLEIKSSNSDNSRQLYIHNGYIDSSLLRISTGGAIQAAVLGGTSSLSVITFGSVLDMTTNLINTITLATASLLPGGNENAVNSIGSSTQYWSNGYFTSLNATSLISTTATIENVTPANAYSHIGGNTSRWAYAYFVDLTTSNQPTVDSDIRLKSNISTLSPSFKELFDKIEVKSYNFINETSQRTHLGVIAQEVVQAIKDSNLSNLACVSYNEESDRYSVAYGEISMLHLAHYKDFLKTYTNKIASLEKEISELRKEIQNLQKS